MTISTFDEQVQFVDTPVSELPEWRPGEEPSPRRLSLLGALEDSPTFVKDALLNSLSHSLERTIAQHLAKVEEAVAAYFFVDLESKDIDIWTELSTYTREARYKVYEQERRIIHEFQDFSLSFCTTNRRGAMAPQSVSYTKVDLTQVRPHA